MNRLRKQPASLKAEAFCEELIKEQTACNDPHLPSLRVLARMAEVSYPVMQRALARLRAEGVLEIRHGSGVLVRRLAPALNPAAEQPPRPGYLTVQRWLEMQILSGQWPGGEVLPSPKELCGRYGVSHRTLRKALLGLCAKGYAQPWRRGYRVRPVALKPGARTVVLLMRGGPDGEIVYASPRTQSNLRILDLECARAGVSLAVVTAEVFTRRWCFPGGSDHVLYRPDAGKGVLGYIVWSDAVDTQMLSGVAPLLQENGRPVAVFDEGGTRSLLPGLAPASMRRFITAHSEEPGRQMGRFLLQLGHRRVIYLAQDETVPWSHSRLAGLKDVFNAAGQLHNVTVVSSAGIPVQQANSLEAYDALLKLLEKGLPAAQRAAFALTARTLRSHGEDIRVFIRDEGTLTGLQPLLKKAVVQSAADGCTAWVAENDLLAIAAMGALKRAGIKVPQSLSLTGFDDSDDAHERGLTSYNFNGAGYMHAILRWVLEAPATLRGRGGEIAELDGFIVERGTTGMAG